MPPPLLLLLALTFPAHAADTPEIALLRKRLDAATNARRNSDAEATYAFDCSPVAKPRPGGKPTPGAFPFKLNRPNRDLRIILALLKRTSSGREKTEEFERRHTAGEFLLTDANLHGTKHCPDKALACYYPDTKTMYVNREAELGSLAPVFFHEIVHALDRGLSESREKVLALREKLKVLLTEKSFPQAVDVNVRLLEAVTVMNFRAERLAYDEGHEAYKELALLFPDYYRTNHFRNPKDAEIVKHRALSPKTIEKYLRGNCAKI